MIKWIAVNKWAVAMVFVGVVGCMTAGCFKVASPAKAAADSAAKAVPAAASGGASVGAFLADIGSATAGTVVSEHMSPFFLAGLGFVLLGGVTFVFGGKATGVCLFLFGIGTVWTGVLFIQYPWIALVIAIVIGVLLTVMTYGRYKARTQLIGTEAEAALRAEELGAFTKATEFIAQSMEAVKGGQEVKAAIRALGPEPMAAVKKVITPIKEKLALTGTSTTAETART